MQKLPVEETRESLFTEAVFGMLGGYLMNERDRGRLAGHGPEIERVNENRILWRFGTNAMSITINEVSA